MEYIEAMDYLESLKLKGFILGLDNIKSLMDEFDNPQNKMKVIHIAGTNGKGSTSTYISSVLTRAGYKTGLYTSPSIIRFSERFKVDNIEIDEKEIAQIVGEIKRISEEKEINITAFEAETALAINYFARKNCEFAVLEVGMGGRLDATNFVEKPILDIIVNIGLDHTDFLGDTIEKIAEEKAGIIKENVSVISYDQKNSVKEVLDKFARDKKTRVEYLDFSDIKEEESSIVGQSFSFKDFKEIEISMIGKYQPKNAALALMAIEKLRELGIKIEDSAVKEGMKKARIMGRFQIVSDSPIIIVDGAHNPQGVESLVTSLKDLFGNKKHIFIFGSLRDKDYHKSIELTKDLAKLYLTTRPDSERALSSIDLKNEIIARGGKAIAMGIAKEALKKALEIAETDDTIVCFGSLYQVGEVMDYLNIK